MVADIASRWKTAPTSVSSLSRLAANTIGYDFSHIEDQRVLNRVTTIANTKHIGQQYEEIGATTLWNTINSVKCKTTSIIKPRKMATDMVSKKLRQERYDGFHSNVSYTAWNGKCRDMPKEEDIKRSQEVWKDLILAHPEKDSLYAANQGTVGDKIQRVSLQLIVEVDVTNHLRLLRRKYNNI